MRTSILIVGALAASLVAGSAQADDLPLNRPGCLLFPIRRVNWGFNQMFVEPSRPEPAHDGLDVAVAAGTPVRAPADGLVTFAGLDRYATNVITVNYAPGRAYILGHLSSIYVHRGQRVKCGDVIGASGGKVGVIGSGRYTTGPHFHIGLVVRGKPIDPLDWFCLPLGE